MTKTRLYLVKPINEAINAVTKEMTSSLRILARIDGWENDDVSGITVKSKPSMLSGTKRVEKFNATYPDTESAFASEFGTEGGSPKGTVRKFMANSRPWEKRMAKSFERKTFKGK